MTVLLNGRDLTIDQVIEVCRNHEKTALAPEAEEAVKKARGQSSHIRADYRFWKVC